MRNFEPILKWPHCPTIAETGVHFLYTQKKVLTACNNYREILAFRNHKKRKDCIL